MTFLYYEAVSKLMLDVHNQSAPINITKLITKTSHIHTYSTRSSKSQLFSTKYLRINLQERLSHVFIANEFKTLSKNFFKGKLRSRKILP